MKKGKCTAKQLEALAKGRAKRKATISKKKTVRKKKTSKPLNGTKKQSEVLTIRDLEMLTSQLKSVRYSFIAAGQRAVTKQTQNKMFSVANDMRKQHNDLIKFFEVKLDIRDDSKIKFL